MRININSFEYNLSMKFGLKFLRRRTTRAREKEKWLYMKMDEKR